jgi:hypothetical protein
MEDVKWFSLEDVRKAVKISTSFDVAWTDSAEFKIPPPVALAHVLIKAWSEGKK